jgi:hypothetical protein
MEFVVSGNIGNWILISVMNYLKDIDLSELRTQNSEQVLTNEPFCALPHNHDMGLILRILQLSTLSLRSCFSELTVA